MNIIVEQEKLLEVRAHAQLSRKLGDLIVRSVKVPQLAELAYLLR
jgi:hypothetical protein